jgi:RNA polymerase sigma-70 factor, ECF subfamily
MFVALTPDSCRISIPQWQLNPYALTTCPSAEIECLPAARRLPFSGSAKSGLTPVSIASYAPQACFPHFAPSGVCIAPRTGSGRDARGAIWKPPACVLIGAAITQTGETRAQLKVSDAMLVARIVQRDESALAALYDRYAGMLSSVLNRILRDTQAAEEILQDIFYELWRSASRFDPERGSLPGWLLVIARNRAISRLRRHNPAAGEELVETMVIVPANLESAVAQQQLLGKVKNAMDNLPQEQRATLELAYYEGLTHSEIAQRTGDPLGTVKTRLRTAVETLKRNLQI